MPLLVLFTLPRFALVVCDLLCFHMNFNTFLLFCEECHWNFDGECLKSVHDFWWHNHFHVTDFANPIVWTVVPTSCIFFDFFSFFMSPKFHCEGLTSPQVGLFLGLFESIVCVNGIFFLISFSIRSLLVHIKAAGFWLMLLYFAILLKVFINRMKIFTGVHSVF